MIKSQLLFGSEARDKIMKGVNIMAEAVGGTLGPKGMNVAIAKYVPNTGEIYQRIILHDGVSVANSIDLEDEFENMGAQILKQAAQKTVDIVGDGTSVSVILAQAILQECLPIIAAGTNPMSLREGLEQGVEELCKELEKLAVPIKGIKDMEYVASISAEDKQLGVLVAEVLDKVGKEGVVTVEESKSPFTSKEYQEGMQLDRGFVHPWFQTNPNRQEAALENAYFLVTDLPYTSFAVLEPLFTSFVKRSKMLVVISPDISGDALALLLQNKMEGKLFSIGIQAPSFGDDQKSILQDIAILTGAKYISGDAGYKLEDVTVDDLGFAEYVNATKDTTVIVGGKGTAKEIRARVASIKEQLKETDGEYDKERLKARMGKLTSGVAVIRVGGQTEVEMKERRERVIDAVAATRAAMDKGIVAGGEIVYLHVRKILKHMAKFMKMEKKGDWLYEYGEPRLTDQILYKALYKPFLKLITNAGLSEVEMALVLNGKKETWGIDVMDGQAKDMIEARIIDPVAVPINALRNALSVSVQLLTTATIIVPKVDHDKQVPKMQ